MIQTLPLDGVWKLRCGDGHRGRGEMANRDSIDPTRYIDATVPGEAHLEAWKQGWIDDPYVGLNCLRARWVEDVQWSYRREFVASNAARTGRAWLVFDGLDYAAKIVLNGQEIAQHRNVFYPCRVEVTGKLRPGKNVLAVHLDSGIIDTLYRGTEKDAGYLGEADRMLPKRQFMRKPQSQFSWDWSPRLVNVGIFKSVRLEWTRETARVDQLVPLASLSPDMKRGSVRVRWFVEGLSARKELRGALTLELLEEDIKISAPVTIKPGLHPIEATIELENPKLWWPVGHGRPNRYTLRARLRIAGKLIGEKTVLVGFRHVRINQDPHPESGRYFTVEINGRKIFCQGGNLVPADMIFSRIDRARYRKLIDRALEANFNLLRVWGGGLYEGDDFYELCDECGVLVWQEFIFACRRYPTTDEAFMADFRREATHNIRRLASHPCLIVWCGNNEMEQAAWDWGYDRRGIILPDYATFHLVIPRILAEEDPTRFYWPSSPYSPDGLPPTQNDVGDQHPWSIGFFNTDFRGYRPMICRFPNEGGILGPTSLATMKKCFENGVEKIGNYSWQTHDNAIDSWAEPSPANAQIDLWLGKKVYEMSLEDWCYFGGLVQGEGLREYIDNFRRRMFSSASAIFWMFNDCWPATRSWTIVDYYLRRTPSFYPVKRAMAPISVVVAEEGQSVVIFGVNATQRPVEAMLRFGIFELRGKYPLDRQTPVRLAPNAATPLASFPRKNWKDPNRSIAFAMLTQDGQLLARNRLILPLFKELKWPKAKVSVRLSRGRAIFRSENFAWGVCLDLNGEKRLADNFFDVWPGIEYTIPWTAKEKPAVIRVGNLA